MQRLPKRFRMSWHDVMLCLVRLSLVPGIYLDKAVNQKLAKKDGEKYSVEDLTPAKK